MDQRNPLRDTNNEQSACTSSSAEKRSSESIFTRSVNHVQHALIETLIFFRSKKMDEPTQAVEILDEVRSQNSFESYRLSLEQSVRSLSIQTCPQKLETLGDNRILVIPRWAFFINIKRYAGFNSTSLKKGGNEFETFLSNFADINVADDGETGNSTLEEFQSKLWENLARTFMSSSVVRRGDIDPKSVIRESGHRILWPRPSPDETGDSNCGFTISSTGPASSGWVTVTEHRIKQSFDLTRVMFSRGNVTEKKRFGLLVQPGENVLDMYAGIGYYTLPALIHGKAKHVTACEWNPHALYALKYNLKANGVDDKVTVLEGDCSITLRDYVKCSIECNYFDRISLGLLPSSEGGWDVAVPCLNQRAGGWMHIHGTVLRIERDHWAQWVCQSLQRIANKGYHQKLWHAVCVHIERVKSFAPKIDHYVADIFVGPVDSPKCPLDEEVFGTGIIDTHGVFHQISLEVSPPSCALKK